MSRKWKPKKQTVRMGAAEVRPSRIRRDPVPAEKPKSAIAPWRSSEREIWLAIGGVVAFAVAIDIIIVAIGAYWQ